MADFLQSPIPEVLVNQRLVPATQQLTDGATINIDASQGDVCVVTLGGNRTLAAPTNPKGGQHLTLIVKQDGTGSRTLTFNAVFAFYGTVTLNPSASATTVYEFVYDSAAAKWQCITASTAVSSFKSGTVTTALASGIGTATVGAAYDGKPVVVSFKNTGVLSGAVIPQIKASVAGGTLTVTLIDKNGNAFPTTADTDVYYLIDGR